MVELREITKDDYEECLKLTVADNQKTLFHQPFSLQRKHGCVMDTAFPFAIYADDTMVGFIMLGYSMGIYDR